MLNYFLENDLIRIHDCAPSGWEEAIRISSQNLLGKGIISPEYIDRIILNVREHGPYIVIAPGIAIPHAAADGNTVHGTAISFDKFKEPVSFSGGGSQKSAQLFFTLAARDPGEHARNISGLADMLMEEGLPDALIRIETVDGYRDVLKEFGLPSAA